MEHNTELEPQDFRTLNLRNITMEQAAELLERLERESQRVKTLITCMKILHSLEAQS